MIYKEKIPAKFTFLGRNIEHDERSRMFAFDTSDIQIVDVTHERYVPIFNQGQVGSCTGNAGIGAISTSPFLNQDNLIYTRDENGALKLYSDAEKIDGGQGYPPQDNGSTGLSIAKSLTNNSLISSYQHTFTLNDALKALTQYPIIVGINWYSQMFTPDADGRVHPNGTIDGGHEVEAYRIDTENSRIWFHNSWGNTWGLNGDFYLTWADFATLLGQGGDVVVLIPPHITPPTPVPAPSYPTLKIGSKGQAVVTLQTLLNKNGANLVTDGIFGNNTQNAVITYQKSKGLVADGIVGKMTWASLNGTGVVDIITQVCNQNGIDPLIGISVATCESGLNPNATLYNPPSKSTDRGLFQWNNVYHPEITDAMAFDPTQATQLFCNALKANKANLHNYWSASEPCWKPKLAPAIIEEYGL